MTCMLLFGSLLLSTLDEALLIKQTFFFFLFCSTIINACLSQLLFEVLLIIRYYFFSLFALFCIYPITPILRPPLGLRKNGLYSGVVLLLS